jgi:hypothetical protein
MCRLSPPEGLELGDVYDTHAADRGGDAFFYIEEHGARRRAISKEIPGES